MDQQSSICDYLRHSWNRRPNKPKRKNNNGQTIAVAEEVEEEMAADGVVEVAEDVLVGGVVEDGEGEEAVVNHKVALRKRRDITSIRTIESNTIRPLAP